MAISPEIEIPVMEEDAEEQEQFFPSRTYGLDFENGRIMPEMIEGIEAIKQFIYLALRTPRYEYPIFSSDVGSEIHQLLKDEEATIEYKKAELPRLIEDALIYDDRIESVDQFEIEHINNEFHVSFVVTTVEGTIEIEEVIDFV